MFSSIADYYSSVVSITAEVARTYAVIRTFEVLIELAQENARIQEEGQAIAESRFRAGATSNSMWRRLRLFWKALGPPSPSCKPTCSRRETR